MPPRTIISMKKSTVGEVPVGPPLKKAKKSRNKSDVVYSQPADSGTGEHRMTQLVNAVICLKNNKNPMNLQDLAIVSDTPLFTDPDLLQKFKAHDRVIYNPKTKLYSYRYDHSYKDKATLLAEIQRHTINSGGLAIKALKESDKDAIKLVEELEKEGEILVTRTAKDRQMRHVFWNEIKPTEEAGGKLVEEEFREVWKSLVVPDDAEVVKYLESEGIPAQPQAAVLQEAHLKPPTIQKRGGKKKTIKLKPGRVTNSHLKNEIDLTKDYVPSTSSTSK